MLFGKKKKRETGDTYKERVERFWAWFAQSADHFKQVIDNGRCGDLVEETEKNVKAMAPLAWVYGPGQKEGRHSFTISPEGDRSRQLLAEYWLVHAPDLPFWDFYGAKQPSLDITDKTVEMNDMDFHFSEVWLSTSLNKERELIDINAWHPMFEHMDENACYSILFILLDEVLGEFGTENWIGAIELSQKRFDEAIPIKELPEFIEQTQKQTGWEKLSPLDAYTGYSYKEPPGGFLRGDIFVGSSNHMELVEAWQEAKGKPDDLLEGSGADFVFTAITSAILPEGKEVDTRAEIEDAVDERLERVGAGKAIGGAIGSDHFYSDYILFDGENSIEIIRKTLESLNIPPGTGIHYFAKDRQRMDVIL